jgi:hypothetical protein
VGGLIEDKNKKRFSDMVIKKSVELFGFTPDEKSDNNLKWMLENGYRIKQRRGRPGHPPRGGL